jgi:predicted amidophosphoribosyltransferase
MDALNRLTAPLRRWVLPWRCLLCADAGAEGVDLCPACIAEFPRNTHCCERCALPPHIALLDDVFTTGATLAECAKVLKRAGVVRVDVWALARAPIPGR